VPPERDVDLAPQVVHVLVDDVRPAVVGEIPDRLDDLGPGQHPARVPEEELEQGELFRRQVQPGPGPPWATGCAKPEAGEAMPIRLRLAVAFALAAAALFALGAGLFASSLSSAQLDAGC
jgi:hypothetical protein